MPYRELYEYVQDMSPKIKTGDLKSKVLEITEFSVIKEFWGDGLTSKNTRGVFIKGPRPSPCDVPEDGALIFLSRELNRCWRRFVLTKELMHTFDGPHEVADGREELDNQLFDHDLPANRVSPQKIAENKASWRALAVLCPEKDRIQLKKQFEDGDLTAYQFALVLKVPEIFVPHLMRDDFLEVVALIMDD